MEPEMKVIRPAGWLFVVLAVGELIALSGAVFVGLEQGLTSLTVGLAALSLVFSAGFVDLAVSRIELAPDALRITELLRRQSIAKGDITSAKTEGGAVFLQLQDGRWLKLPNTGRNSLGVLNSIRAWLKAR